MRFHVCHSIVFFLRGDADILVFPPTGVGETNYDIDWAGGVGLGSGGVVVIVMVVLVLVVGLFLVGLRTFVFC